MQKTLVTGASGFVGTHLMEEMKRRGLPVCGVSRGETPGLMTIPSYGREMNWSNCLKGVDTVIHLAARVHVMRETASDPLSVFREANVTGTINIARQAAEAGIRRFVFVSSIKVNGERTEPGKPFTADDPPNPQDPYAVSKAEAEVGLMELAGETGMEVTIVRPPLVYGRGVRGNYHSLLKWAASGMPSLFSAVENKRSLVHVSNLCDLLIKVIHHPRAGNRTYLVSDGHDLSTDELLCRLIAGTGRTPRRIPIPTPVISLAGMLLGRTDAVAKLTESLQVDISSTCVELDWTPQYDTNF